jgi:thioredoxin 1
MMGVFSLEERNFTKEVLNSPQVILVDFSASWCGPCRLMAPVIEEIAEEFKGKIKVGKVDIDKAPALAQRYEIQAVPTLIIFEKGKITKKLVGLQSKEKLIEELKLKLTPKGKNQ